MLTEYTVETSRWEGWQREYRSGVLLVIPPDPPLAHVDPLRVTCDPRAQSYCGAHISLTVPVPKPMQETHWEELHSIACAIKPVTIHYGPLMNYLPRPAVCLGIEPQSELDTLRAALEAASVFAGASARRYPFSAHMTIAEFVSAEEKRALMQELEGVAPEGVLVCNGVSYVVPDVDFHFTDRERLDLGGGRAT